MSTNATQKPGSQLWGIYYTDREYGREVSDPLRTVVEGPIKIAAEEAAARLGFGDPWPHPTTAAVDRLFPEWNTTNAPGCMVAVSRDGHLLYERGYGMANLEVGVPITAATVLPVASISKQFTAMCILLLAQRGQLSLDDEVWKFFPK